MAADAAKEAAKPIADPAQLEREHAVCLSNRDQALNSASVRARETGASAALKSARLSLSSLPAPRVRFLMDSLRKLGCEPGPIDEFIVCRRASDDRSDNDRHRPAILVIMTLGQTTHYGLE